MTNNMVISCENCIHWSQISEKSINGRCYKNSPKPIAHEKPNIIYYISWPITKTMDKCGEFSPKQE